MKRSEALLEIDNLIYDSECLAEFCRKGVVQQLSLDILSKLESFGMLPPNRPKLIENPNVKTSEDLVKLPALLIKDVNEWNPENE